MSNHTTWRRWYLGSYMEPWRNARNNNGFSLYTNKKFRSNFVNNNWVRAFFSNGNFKLRSLQNILTLMSLKILVIGFINNKDIYNIYICLFITINIFKVKVISLLKCMPFFDVCPSIQGGGDYAATSSTDILNSRNIPLVELMRI